MNAVTSSAFTPRFSASERWGVRLLSLVIWALLAGSAAYWVLRSPAELAGAPAAATVVAEQPTLPSESALARLFGDRGDAAPVADTASAGAAAGNWRSRIMVHGVAAESGGTGAALLVVDGKAPQPYRTGQEVADGWWLAAVTPRTITLQPKVHAAAHRTDTEQERPQRVVLHMQAADAPDAPDAANTARAQGMGAIAPAAPIRQNNAVNAMAGLGALAAVEAQLAAPQSHGAALSGHRKRSARLMHSQDKDISVGGVVSAQPPVQEAPAEQSPEHAAEHLMDAAAKL